jgi:hypothetical protein
VRLLGADLGRRRRRHSPGRGVLRRRLEQDDLDRRHDRRVVLRPGFFLGGFYLLVTRPEVRRQLEGMV